MTETEQRKVRCAECGYLAIREVKKWTLCEAERKYRDDLTTPPNGPDREYQFVPVCFAGEVSFAESLQGSEKEKRAECRSAISRDRECPSFTSWKPGFSPKEHVDMQLVREQREWQQGEEKRRREWQKEQEEDRRKWEARLQTRELSAGAVVAIAAAVLGGLVAQLL